MRTAAAFLLLLLPTALTGQTHRVSNPQQTIRAVGVYEWTGEIKKPAAARLVPVSLFYTGHFEDAGSYLARPVPFAIESGVEYVLQTAGVKSGFLELSYARNLRNSVAATVTGSTPYEDGWFGYGKYRPLPVPKVPKLNTNPRQGNAHTIQEANNRDRAAAGKPHLNTKPAADEDTPPPITDPSDDKNKDPKSTASDPERPTLKRPAADPTDNSKNKKQKDPAASVSQTPPDPASDPDRPSLKKHKAGDSSDNNSEAVSGGDKMLNDPDRPNLHRGRPEDSTAGEDLPQMKGLPVGLHQVAAVSDAKDRPEHDFTHHFENDADRNAVLARIRAIAEFEVLNPGKDIPSTLTAAPAPGQAPPVAATVLAPPPPPATASAIKAPDQKPTPSGTPTAAQKPAATSAQGSANPTTSSTADPTQDPNRPTLHRGKPTTATATKADPITPAPNPVAAPQAPATTLRRGRAATSINGRKPVIHAKSNMIRQPLLTAEQLNAYELSFGATPTYVYTAQTGATSESLRYVTVVAQPDVFGAMQIALRTSTDAAHLDRTPWMRPIDVVDADATNRASLLVELRGQNSRQFALYRILAGKADQTYLSGTTQ